jgi:cation transport ATPase
MAETGSSGQLRLADVINDRDDLQLIVDARRLSRFTRRLAVAVAVVVFGVLSLVATVVLYLTGTISVDEAVNSVTITALGAILAGIASYGSSVALNLSASNLARRMQQTTESN